MIVSDVELEPVVEQEIPPALYQVGEKVICTTIFNNPGYYGPGEKLKGRVKSRFWNAALGWTYRLVEVEIQLERNGIRCLERVTIGNVTEWFLSRA